MSAPSKRLKISQEPICIIHDDINCKSEDIILLSDVKNPDERFKRIHEVRTKRLAEPAHSVHRKQSICDQVPTEYSSNHGYHRECHQKFTANLSRLKGQVDTHEPSTSTRPRRSTQEQIIFMPDCIFCHKEARKKLKIGGQWTTEPLTKFEFGGGKAVVVAAEERNDTELLTRIRGYDLFSCKAQFHSSCRKQYVNTSVHWRSSSLEAKTKQSEMEMAHQAAFNGVCVSFDKALIAKQGVCKMTDLLQLYISHLQESPFPNPK